MAQGKPKGLWSVILPNVRPSLATLILVKFLFSWNAFLWPLVAIQTQENQVIQVAVAHSAAQTICRTAASPLLAPPFATIPLLFLQFYFVRGLATTAMKVMIDVVAVGSLTADVVVRTRSFPAPVVTVRAAGLALTTPESGLPQGTRAESPSSCPDPICEIRAR